MEKGRECILLCKGPRLYRSNKKSNDKVKPLRIVNRQRTPFCIHSLNKKFWNEKIYIEIIWEYKFTIKPTHTLRYLPY